MSFDDSKSLNSVCEACGKKFFCGAQSGKCWCFEIDLAEKSLEKINEDYKKCLCRECLLAYTERQTFSNNL